MGYTCGAVCGHISITFNADKSSYTVTYIHILHWLANCGTVWAIVVLRALHSEAHVKLYIRYVVDTSVSCSLSEVRSKFKLKINAETTDDDFSLTTLCSSVCMGQE